MRKWLKTISIGSLPCKNLTLKNPFFIKRVDGIKRNPVIFYMSVESFVTFNSVDLKKLKNVKH